jgi:hypothetical protein
MGLEPPQKERVESWAKRAMPVFTQFREQFSKGTDEFREVLGPAQRAKFELQALQFDVGMQFAERKLEEWQRGEFEEHEFWEPVGDHRSRHEERRRGRMREPEERAETRPEETDQIALELTAWEKYVEAFIRIYRLDHGQRTTVFSVLSELKQRALAHRDRYRDDIAGLERLIEGFSGSDQELADLKEQLTRFYGPIDDMFRELKRRIESVPTAEQRAAVAAEEEDQVATPSPDDTTE